MSEEILDVKEPTNQPQGSPSHQEGREGTERKCVWGCWKGSHNIAPYSNSEIQEGKQYVVRA